MMGPQARLRVEANVSMPVSYTYKQAPPKSQVVKFKKPGCFRVLTKAINFLRDGGNSNKVKRNKVL